VISHTTDTDDSTSCASKRKRPPPKFYAVATGHTTGIFHSWEDCREQVQGYPHNNFKSFPSLAHAQQYLLDNGIDDYTSATNPEPLHTPPHPTAPTAAPTPLFPSTNIYAPLQPDSTHGSNIDNNDQHLTSHEDDDDNDKGLDSSSTVIPPPAT
jgi:hypothetical protein